MNERVLISFLGGHDLNCAENYQENPSAIVQTINEIKPGIMYLFITNEFASKYKSSILKNIIKSLNPKIDIKELFINIEDPTDTANINNELETHLKNINDFIVLNKNQGYVNLTSGTPQIISVLSLWIITGRIQRTQGVYAPNPKYQSAFKLDKLEFFKSSVGYETIKKLLEKQDFSGLLNLIKKDTYFKNKFIYDKDFIEILEFANHRFISDFKKAKEIYFKSNILQEKFINFDLRDEFDYCKERYFTLNTLINNNDNAQAVIWMAIIRETLIFYLLNKLLPGGLESISDKDNEKDIYRLNERKIDSDHPKLKEFLLTEWEKGLYHNRLDLNRELNQAVARIILNYAGDTFAENKDLWKKFKSSFDSLEEVVKIRNILAHKIAPPKYKPIWCKQTKEMLSNISKLLNINTDLDINPYKKIEEILFNKLEILF